MSRELTAMFSPARCIHTAGLVCGLLSRHIQVTLSILLSYPSYSYHSPLSRLDGKHVVFGSIVDGMDVVRKIESYGSSSGKTSKEIKIADCGQL